jgi:hypothetical protein
MEPRSAPAHHSAARPVTSNDVDFTLADSENAPPGRHVMTSVYVVLEAAKDAVPA